MKLFSIEVALTIYQIVVVILAFLHTFMPSVLGPFNSAVAGLMFGTVAMYAYNGIKIIYF